jgi:hypothetical protein
MHKALSNVTKCTLLAAECLISAYMLLLWLLLISSLSLLPAAALLHFMHAMSQSVHLNLLMVST